MRNSKNNFKNIVFLILLNTILFNSILYAQIPFDWPVDVDPLTGKGQVNGNIGEYRYTLRTKEHRIHKGLDLVGNNASHRILALEDGKIVQMDVTNSYAPFILVESTATGKLTKYVHVRPISGFKVNSLIPRGQYFADMIDIDAEHLHLEYDIDIASDISHNILPLIGLPNPYGSSTMITDNIPPVFETNKLPNSVAFHINGLLKSQATKELTTLFNNRILLYDKLDVAAHVKDYRIDFNGNIPGTPPYAPANPGQLAPYALGFEIRNSNNQQIIENNSDNFRYSYDFDISPNDNKANYLFHPESVHPGSPSIHIITCNAESAGVVDRYWNTRLKRSTTQEWPQKGSTGYSSQNASRNN